MTAKLAALVAIVAVLSAPLSHAGFVQWSALLELPAGGEAPISGTIAPVGPPLLTDNAEILARTYFVPDIELKAPLFGIDENINEDAAALIVVSSGTRTGDLPGFPPHTADVLFFRNSWLDNSISITLAAPLGTAFPDALLEELPPISAFTETNVLLLNIGDTDYRGHLTSLRFVPEPASLALFLLAVPMMLWGARRWH